MKWEVIVDNEWLFEGTYEQCEEVAMRYWSDDEFWGDCRMISENEFYGYEVENESPCDLYGMCPYDEHCEYHCYGKMYQ